jgi:N-acetylmuramoyl-L-alanine amidase
MTPLPSGGRSPAGAGAADPPKARRLRVVIDPGHGGKDPGARGPAGTEKESVLDIGLRLAAKLRSNLGVEVHMTRTDDSYVSLAERKDLANRMEADLFISIHANASPNGELSGIETYYLQNSDDRATLRLAKLENGVEKLIKGSDVSTDADLNFILSDIIQGQKEADSVLLATHVQDQLCSNLEKRYRSIRSLGVKQGPFLVLDGTYMPSILVETGFITNSGDEGRRLGAAAYREAVADGIYRGIRAYLEDDRAHDLT